MPKMISAKGTAYQTCKKTKCSTCGTKDELTVHHKVPNSILKAYGIVEVPTSIFETLCQKCHAEYTHHENQLKMRMDFLILPKVYRDVTHKTDALKDPASNIKDSTRTRFLNELSFFYRRTVTMENIDGMVMDENRCVSGVIPYEQMSKMWLSDFRSWKANKLITLELERHFEQ